MSLTVLTTALFSWVAVLCYRVDGSSPDEAWRSPRGITTIVGLATITAQLGQVAMVLEVTR